MVSGKTVEDALALMERAWRRRYEAFQAPGASEEDTGRVLVLVRRELEEGVEEAGRWVEKLAALEGGDASVGSSAR